MMIGVRTVSGQFDIVVSPRCLNDVCDDPYSKEVAKAKPMFERLATMDITAAPPVANKTRIARLERG